MYVLHIIPCTFELCTFNLIALLVICYLQQIPTTLCLNGRFEARAPARSLSFGPASLTGHVPARIAKKCHTDREREIERATKKQRKEYLFNVGIGN